VRFPRARAAHLALGRAGERAAAKYLETHLCKILARNCRFAAGELDIVALDGGTLLFVEVKTLRERPGFSPVGNLSLEQRRRNHRAAKSYLAMLKERPRKVRFDLVEVVFRRRRVVAAVRTCDYLPPL